MQKWHADVQRPVLLGRVVWSCWACVSVSGQVQGGMHRRGFNT